MILKADSTACKQITRNIELLVLASTTLAPFHATCASPCRAATTTLVQHDLQYIYITMFLFIEQWSGRWDKDLGQLWNFSSDSDCSKSRLKDRLHSSVL